MTVDACSWDTPGANPYRGDPIVAIADYEMPESTRAYLKELMTKHQYSAMVTITRDEIPGFIDQRDMHSGHGVMCHGLVNRSKWKSNEVQRGLVYCADEVCVLVPTICNNVSLITPVRKQEEAKEDAPIDIEPGGGVTTPPSVPVNLPPSEPTWQTTSNNQPPYVFPESPPFIPVIYGGGACCIRPIKPICPPPPSVPEPSTWALLLTGLISMLTFRIRAKFRSCK